MRGASLTALLVAASEAVVAGCDATAMEIVACDASGRLAPPPRTARTRAAGNVDALAPWDKKADAPVWPIEMVSGREGA